MSQPPTPDEHPLTPADHENPTAPQQPRPADAGQHVGGNDDAHDPGQMPEATTAAIESTPRHGSDHAVDNAPVDNVASDHGAAADADRGQGLPELHDAQQDHHVEHGEHGRVQQNERGHGHDDGHEHGNSSGNDHRRDDQRPHAPPSAHSLVETHVVEQAQYNHDARSVQGTVSAARARSTTPAGGRRSKSFGRGVRDPTLHQPSPPRSPRSIPNPHDDDHVFGYHKDGRQFVKTAEEIAEDAARTAQREARARKKDTANDSLVDLPFGGVPGGKAVPTEHVPLTAWEFGDPLLVSYITWNMALTPPPNDKKTLGQMLGAAGHIIAVATQENGGYVASASEQQQWVQTIVESVNHSVSVKAAQARTEYQAATGMYEQKRRVQAHFRAAQSAGQQRSRRASASAGPGEQDHDLDPNAVHDDDDDDDDAGESNALIDRKIETRRSSILDGEVPADDLEAPVPPPPPLGYHVLAAPAMMATQLVVIARADVAPHIVGLHTALEKTGLGSVMGNKGAAAVAFTIVRPSASAPAAANRGASARQRGGAMSTPTSGGPASVSVLERRYCKSSGQVHPANVPLHGTLEHPDGAASSQLDQSTSARGGQHAGQGRAAGATGSLSSSGRVHGAPGGANDGSSSGRPPRAGTGPGSFPATSIAPPSPAQVRYTVDEAQARNRRVLPANVAVPPGAATAPAPTALDILTGKAQPTLPAAPIRSNDADGGAGQYQSLSEGGAPRGHGGEARSMTMQIPSHLGVEQSARGAAAVDTGYTFARTDTGQGGVFPAEANAGFLDPAVLEHVDDATKVDSVLSAAAQIAPTANFSTPYYSYQIRTGQLIDESETLGELLAQMKDDRDGIAPTAVAASKARAAMLAQQRSSDGSPKNETIASPVSTRPATAGGRPGTAGTNAALLAGGAAQAKQQTKTGAELHHTLTKHDQVLYDQECQQRNQISLLFVGAHLAPHQDNVAKRNLDYKTIVENLTVGTKGPVPTAARAPAVGDRFCRAFQPYVSRESGAKSAEAALRKRQKLDLRHQLSATAQHQRRDLSQSGRAQNNPNLTATNQNGAHTLSTANGQSRSANAGQSTSQRPSRRGSFTYGTNGREGGDQHRLPHHHHTVDTVVNGNGAVRPAIPAASGLPAMHMNGTGAEAATHSSGGVVGGAVGGSRGAVSNSSGGAEPPMTFGLPAAIVGPKAAPLRVVGPATSLGTEAPVNDRGGEIKKGQAVREHQAGIEARARRELLNVLGHSKRSSAGTFTRDCTDEFDVVFFGGDLNYRINGTKAALEKIIEHHTNLRSILTANDQCTAEKRKGNILHGFAEGRLTFAPTYKYHREEDGLYGDRYDAGKKQRLPAFCDRVFFKAHPGYCKAVSAACQETEAAVSFVLRKEFGAAVGPGTGTATAEAADAAMRRRSLDHAFDAQNQNHSGAIGEDASRHAAPPPATASAVNRNILAGPVDNDTGAVADSSRSQTQAPTSPNVPKLPIGGARHRPADDDDEEDVVPVQAGGSSGELRLHNLPDNRANAATTADALVQQGSGERVLSPRTYYQDNARVRRESRLAEQSGSGSQERDGDAPRRGSGGGSQKSAGQAPTHRGAGGSSRASSSGDPAASETALDDHERNLKDLLPAFAGHSAGISWIANAGRYHQEVAAGLTQDAWKQQFMADHGKLLAPIITAAVPPAAHTIEHAAGVLLQQEYVIHAANAVNPNGGTSRGPSRAATPRAMSPGLDDGGMDPVAALLTTPPRRIFGESVTPGSKSPYVAIASPGRQSDAPAGRAAVGSQTPDRNTGHHGHTLQYGGTPTPMRGGAGSHPRDGSAESAADAQVFSDAWSVQNDGGIAEYKAQQHRRQQQNQILYLASLFEDQEHSEGDTQRRSVSKTAPLAPWVRLLHYGDVHGIRTSDHRPVVALVAVETAPDPIKAADAAFTTACKIVEEQKKQRWLALRAAAVAKENAHQQQHGLLGASGSSMPPITRPSASSGQQVDLGGGALTQPQMMAGKGTTTTTAPPPSSLIAVAQEPPREQMVATAVSAALHARGADGTGPNLLNTGTSGSELAVVGHGIGGGADGIDGGSVRSGRSGRSGRNGNGARAVGFDDSTAATAAAIVQSAIAATGHTVPELQQPRTPAPSPGPQAQGPRGAGGPGGPRSRNRVGAESDHAPRGAAGFTAQGAGCCGCF